MTPIERFWAKVDKDSDPHGCWVWTGALTSHGYGHGYVNKVHFTAHRRSYESLVGAISPGLDLDHLCRNRACVNPAHLEPVTRQENILRGMTIPAAHAKKTHCPEGHQYDEANTAYSSTGSRQCITCRRTRARRKYLARPAEWHAAERERLRALRRKQRAA